MVCYCSKGSLIYYMCDVSLYYCTYSLMIHVALKVCKHHFGRVFNGTNQNIVLMLQTINNECSIWCAILQKVPMSY